MGKIWDEVEQLRHDRVMRRRIKPPVRPPAGLTVRVAESGEELEAAFGLAYDAYLEAGFTSEAKSRLRTTKYHTLPTTTVIVAVIGNEVVGTASLIQDSPLGLPSGSVFDLNAFSANGAHVVEVSSLAIRKQLRSAEGEVLFPLIKYILEYSQNYLRASRLLIGVNPRHFSFYRAILLFEPMEAGTVERYEFANGNPTVGATLSLRDAPARWRAVARFEPHFAEVAEYFTGDSLPNLHYPQRPYFIAWDSVLNAELVEYLFARRTCVLPSLSGREARYLVHLYGLERIGHLLPALDLSEPFPVRYESRYPVACFAEGKVGGEVRNASQNGLKLIGAERLPHGEFSLRVRVGTGMALELRTEARWSDGRGSHGVKVISPPPEWSAFVDYLSRASRRNDGVALPHGFAAETLELPCTD